MPTPFAQRLQQPLHEWLETAAGLFVHEDFDPATWKGELMLVAHEYLHVTLVPRLLALLHERAPGMKLKVHSQYSHQLHGLELGEIDFVLNLEFSNSAGRVSVGGDVHGRARDPGASGAIRCARSSGTATIFCAIRASRCACPTPSDS